MTRMIHAASASLHRGSSANAISTVRVNGVMWFSPCAQRGADGPPVSMLHALCGVSKGKGMETATQMMSALTRTALAVIEAQRGRDAVYVFPSPRGGMALYVTDKLHLDQLCATAGVGRWSWHQIRHWVGTVAARAGKNRRAIADLLGQQSVSATDRYIHAAASEVWEMAGELERVLGGGDGGGDGDRNDADGSESC